MEGSSILALSNLLKDSQYEADKKYKKEENSYNPGLIGDKKKKTTTIEDIVSEHNKNKKKINKNDIWNDDDVDEEFIEEDPRTEPEYDLIYRQKVTTEDIYLGMSGKTPGFQDCDEMVITVKLPGVKKISDIELTVYENKIDVKTSTYRLNLPLPKPILENDGNAKWKKDKSELVLNLPLKKEFSF
ncbi:hypothetical protein BCR32DRAFT_295766 [Anaeromyces robustus]|uniref:CS domain-containing protein n=1 Tax=Anaeromyces robustus TaxID=1754192 RepID=A0A1Y1WUM4_9FUNG|nr:hypothetical protein BCR32DRAFT_295766 [Anaeromyces robustus]|eukprot:ORX77213.1 hypothetical protein BCR32DRAFT_295766 [Anaeromyces robustus]